MRLRDCFLSAARSMSAAMLSATLSSGIALPMVSMAALGAVFTSSAQAASLEGQVFEGTAVLSGRTLRLNGLGLRGVAWVKAFVAGLYVPSTSQDPSQLIGMPGPKRLRLKIMLQAPSSALSKSLLGRIEDHESPETQAQLADRLSSLSTLIDGIGDLHLGDALDLDYVPQQGVQLRLNGRLIGAPVPGEDLYAAVLKIFVGDHPVDTRMKEGLLRGGA